MATTGYVRSVAAGLAVLAVPAVRAQAQSSEALEAHAAVGEVSIRYAMAGPRDAEAIVLIGGTARRRRHTHG